MRKQTNMTQMREQNKTPEKEPTKGRYAIYQMQNSKHWLLGCSWNSLGRYFNSTKKAQAEMKVTQVK